MDWRNRSRRGNWALRPVRGSVRCRSISALTPRALVQLTWKKQTSIGGDCRPTELDAKLGIEREANRIRCRVTHWMMPSATREAPQKPAFLAGAERLWPGAFSLQNENAGSDAIRSPDQPAAERLRIVRPSAFAVFRRRSSSS